MVPHRLWRQRNWAGRSRRGDSRTRRSPTSKKASASARESAADFPGPWLDSPGTVREGVWFEAAERARSEGRMIVGSWPRSQSDAWTAIWTWRSPRRPPIRRTSRWRVACVTGPDIAPWWTRVGGLRRARLRWRGWIGEITEIGRTCREAGSLPDRRRMTPRPLRPSDSPSTTSGGPRKPGPPATVTTLHHSTTCRPHGT